jgi:antitoxin component YwqK of YwqJK toxin-antitoxin module
MKGRLSFLFLMCCLAACNNRTSKSPGNTVQHDTLKTESIVQSSSKDSIIGNGEYIQHYKNGVTKMRGMMKNGKRDGLWKSFYENGSSWSETTFKDGIKEGRTVTWFENEKKRYEGFYKNDVESGKWIFWDDKGNVVTEKDYDLK